MRIENIFTTNPRFEWVISNRVQGSKPIDHPIDTVTYFPTTITISLLSFEILIFVSWYKWIFTGLYFTSENYSLAQVSTWDRNSCALLFTWKHRQRWYLSTQFMPIRGYCTENIAVVVFGITKKLSQNFVYNRFLDNNFAPCKWTQQVVIIDHRMFIWNSNWRLI